LKLNKNQLGSKLITVGYTLKLKFNYAKFERDQRCAFLDIYILVKSFICKKSSIFVAIGEEGVLDFEYFDVLNF
jgi:hypothetical protein